MQDLIDELNSQFGVDTVVTKPLDVRDVIPTGSILLDMAIGVGGYPVGKIIELYGAESVGKSTLCLHAIKNAQAKGMGAVYIDAENSFNTEYATSLGISLSPERLIIVQPGSAEEALSILEQSVQYSSVGIVVLDSVAAMVPTKEAYGQGELGDSHVGLIARIMSQSSRRLTPLMTDSNATVLMVNQIREQISPMPYVQKNSPGGHALKHAMHVRIYLQRKKTIPDYLDGRAAIVTEASIKKNKVSPSFASAEMTIINGVGIDVKAEIVNILAERGLIKKAGSWYKDASGEAIGQGIFSVYEWIDSHEKEIRQLLDDLGVSGIYADKQRNTEGGNSDL